MPLYAADIESLAKPVKKVGGKKRKAEEASQVQEVTPAVTPEPEQKKEKKPPTEKQLAARAKFAENRKKKLEEQAAEKLRLETEVAEKQKEIEAKEAAIAAKKQARAEKRKMKKDEKEIDVAVEKAVEEATPMLAEQARSAADGSKEPKPKKVKRTLKRDESVPPVWFEKFVESAKMEESKIAADKKPAKMVKEEAKEVAKAQWSDGYTRDRVNAQVDNHMGKLYSMIFARK
jgi:colicin import membrane protein